MIERWKAVIGYEGLYEVSCLGRIRSLDTIDSFGRKHVGVVLKDADNGNGYRVVCLHRHGNRRMRTVHSLVAMAFVDNPNEFSEVNHLDGNKSNNRCDNLEFCTHRSNMKHSVKTGLHTNFGQKQVMCVETGTVFDSVKSAEIWAGIKHGNGRISSCCKHRRGAKTCGGYHWRYV